MELKNLKHVPEEIFEMNQKKWGRTQLMQKRFYDKIDKKDVTALEILVEFINSPNMLKYYYIKSTLKELICDSASRIGALTESKGKTTFSSDNG